MSPLPENLEKVADAGGWDARQLEKATKFMQEASKIKKSEWMSMNENLTIMKEIGSASNLDILTSLPDSIMTTISLKTDELFAPLKNEINTLLTTALQPLLDELNPIVNNLTALVGDNAIGGTVGALSGMVVGGFVGSPLIGAFLGGIIGAAIQQAFSQYSMDNLPPGFEYNPPRTDAFKEWANDVNQWWYDYWIAMGWR